MLPSAPLSSSHPPFVYFAIRIPILTHLREFFLRRFRVFASRVLVFEKRDVLGVGAVQPTELLMRVADEEPFLGRPLDLGLARTACIGGLE